MSDPSSDQPTPTNSSASFSDRMENAALELLAQSSEDGDEDSKPFPWEIHYAGELENPEVARLHQFFQGLDTYAVHGSGLDPESKESGQWTYGDTGVPLIYRLLRRWGANDQHRFLDLGCGCGIPTFAASLLVQHAKGVDLIPSVVEFCQVAKRTLSIENAEFVCQDLFETDISQADFIYLATTTFPSQVRKRLSGKLAEAKSGAKIISVTHPFQGRHLRSVVKLPQFFSWSGFGPGYPFEFHLHQRV
jgi:SAM-dependent methyltransferase